MAKSKSLYCLPQKKLCLASILLVGAFSYGNPSYGNLKNGDSRKEYFFQTTKEALEKAERLERLDRKICEMLGISYAELIEIQNNYWAKEKEKERFMKSVENMTKSKMENTLVITEDEIVKSSGNNNYKAPKMTNQIDYIEYPEAEAKNSRIRYHWRNARE